MSITQGVLAQSPEPEPPDKVLDNNPDRKTSRSKDENQQQTQPTYNAESGTHWWRPAWEVNAHPLCHHAPLIIIIIIIIIIITKVSHCWHHVSFDFTFCFFLYAVVVDSSTWLIKLTLSSHKRTTKQTFQTLI